MTEAEFWRRGYIYLLGAVFFICCAIWTGNSGLKSLSKNLEVQNWNITSAKISSAGSMPLFHQQDVIGAYAVATYSYQFNKKEYTCFDVAPDPSFSMDMALVGSAVAYLKKYVASGKEISVHVNPDNPSKAYLLIDSPMGSFLDLLFSSVFVLLAMLLAIVFWTYSVYEDKRNEMKKQYPKQPWRWEPFWQEFKITDAPPVKRLFPLAILSFILITAFLGGSIFILLEGAKSLPINIAMIFLFLFTVMCLYLLKRRHSALSAGFQAELELSQLPVVLGQGCSALIRFREEVEISCVDELELGLLHEDKVAFGSRARTGLDFETKESLVEGSFIKIDFELIDIGRQSALKFVINLPENLACTDLDGDFPKSWKLILKSKQSDLNFYEEFKIPVFELGEGVTAQINSKFPI